MWSPSSNRSAAVAVIIHPNSAVKLVDSKADLAGRVVTALIEFHAERFQIINVYAPNNHRERELFFDSLWRFQFPHVEAIVVGDLIVCRILLISGAAMTVLETGLSRSSTLLLRQ